MVIPDDAYGGTFRLIARVLTEWGVSYRPVAISDLAAVRDALAERPARVLWAETPTNPLLSIADISALADVAHQAGALLVVDNTFASPYLQQPLALGADAVVHSTTKYLGGHSDVVGGAVVVADPGLGERLAFLQNATGAVAGPFDAWLTLRGVKTLAVRMDQHSRNAARVADMLAGHPAVLEVHYPGLPGHPGHEVAAKQMRDFGGMVSFRVRGGAEAAVAACGRTRLFTLGESLGGVESLIEHPGRMTHASVAGSPLEVPDDLIRLSVGIETGGGPAGRPPPGARRDLAQRCRARAACPGPPGQFRLAQGRQTMSTRMTSQMRLTTPASDAIRPRSTVATCAGPGRGGRGRRRGGLTALRPGRAPRPRGGLRLPPAPRPRRRAPARRRGCPPGREAALHGHDGPCWSRMMSTSRTRATTNRVIDAVTHALVISCRDWPAMMPKSSTPRDAAPKTRVIRDR